MKPSERVFPVMASRSGPKLVVGIDFGTTFSGIAWALEACPEEIEVIQKWPDGRNRSLQKVPSCLTYGTSAVNWGYQVNDEVHPNAIRGLKLLLDDSKPVTYRPSIEAKSHLKSLGKSTVDAIADYLRALVGHAKEILRRRFDSALDIMEIQYILTVPAVWSDKAKDLTMQAGCRAGIPRAQLSLLSEPESAAIYAIRAIQPNTMAKHGDCIIVCDAGGGTVDLITYEITQTEPLRLQEVTEGTGGICGSVLLDHCFEELLAQTVGEKMHMSIPRAARLVALNYWQDNIKANYTGPELEEYLDVGYAVPLPGAPDVPGIIEGGFWNLERKVNDTGLNAKAIILVGGLGSSDYIHKRLETKFSDLRGDAANECMVRCCSGATINENEPVRLSFYRNVDINGSFKFCDELSFCVTETAPSQLNKAVSPLCELNADLDKIPKELFEKHKNSTGLEFYRVHFDLVLTPTSASLLFHLEFNDVEYGKVRARYY
ncbi:hypothetical protein N7468_008876 [Penicillium chermesinum]|uniref:Actin-like ATPase domain-containing protein n=1 Tax=Penicillium chermesinum TaxID=63820 RepID=A0A9W9NGR0_9EURO|nr:uncharacterized protein N7468_008876 [Penicillium chermesinum]KAJ5219672.1 hypothetical protein N7468_008876 [Penicillium chermesinum]